MFYLRHSMESSDLQTPLEVTRNDPPANPSLSVSFSNDDAPTYWGLSMMRGKYASVLISVIVIVHMNLIKSIEFMPNCLLSLSHSSFIPLSVHYSVYGHLRIKITCRRPPFLGLLFAASVCVPILWLIVVVLAS